MNIVWPQCSEIVIRCRVTPWICLWPFWIKHSTSTKKLSVFSDCRLNLLCSLSVCLQHTTLPQPRLYCGLFGQSACGLIPGGLCQNSKLKILCSVLLKNFKSKVSLLGKHVLLPTILVLQILFWAISGVESSGPGSPKPSGEGAPLSVLINFSAISGARVTGGGSPPHL